MSNAEEDPRGSMMAACYALLGVWVIFGGFIAWLGMSLVQGGLIEFLEAFSVYAIVSFAVLALLYANMRDMEI
jgi:hypothetical protein